MGEPYFVDPEGTSHIGSSNQQNICIVLLRFVFSAMWHLEAHGLVYHNLYILASYMNYFHWWMFLLPAPPGALEEFLGGGRSSGVRVWQNPSLL